MKQSELRAAAEHFRKAEQQMKRGANALRRSGVEGKQASLLQLAMDGYASAYACLRQAVAGVLRGEET